MKIEILKKKETRTKAQRQTKIRVPACLHHENTFLILKCVSRGLGGGHNHRKIPEKSDGNYDDIKSDERHVTQCIFQESRKY